MLVCAGAGFVGELELKKRKMMCRANLRSKEELEDPSVLVGGSSYASGGAYDVGRQDIASANLPGGSWPGQQTFSAQPMPHPPLPQPQLPPYQPYPTSSQPHPPTRHEVVPPSPDSLPSKPPDRNVFLWLSGELVRWKFVARQLGLTEAEIESICVDHRGEVGEQRYQMLATWERCYFHECSYQKLGQVLLESEGNKHLYPEYVERTKNIEKF